MNFGSGLSGKISSKTKDARKIYAHYGVKLSDRFPQVSIAEDAIQTIREAIHDIYGRMGRQSPVWVDFDDSTGWPQTGGFSATAHPTLLRGKVDQNAPCAADSDGWTWPPARERDLRSDHLSQQADLCRLLGCRWLRFICSSPRPVRWLGCASFPNSFKQSTCRFIARILRHKFHHKMLWLTPAC